MTTGTMFLNGYQFYGFLFQTVVNKIASSVIKMQTQIMIANKLIRVWIGVRSGGCNITFHKHKPLFCLMVKIYMIFAVIWLSTMRYCALFILFQWGTAIFFSENFVQCILGVRRSQHVPGWNITWNRCYTALLPKTDFSKP